MTDAARQPDPAQIAADLRSASDQLMYLLDRLQDLETRKREVAPDDPEFGRLAREVHDVAAAALVGTGVQERLADEVAELAKGREGALPVEPIADIPPGPREATIVLAEWRAAERRLAAAPEGSDDARQARADVERLRTEYARTINLRADDGLGEL
jgi:hypothetical protein